MPFAIESKVAEQVVLPVKLLDLASDSHNSTSLETDRTEARGNTDATEPIHSSQKDTSPVEFRSGYRGVSWNRRMKAWLAFWSEGKNRRSKTFNAKVMGFEKARAAAIDFLKRKKQLLQQADESGSVTGTEEEEFGEGSLADTVTTTSDSPSSSDVMCSSCGLSPSCECSCSSA